jgi:DNA replication protein DnaC
MRRLMRARAAIARSCIRACVRGRFYNVVDLVNRLEAEARNGRQRRLADHLIRMDFVVSDELSYLPFAQSGSQLLFHLISRLHERTSALHACIQAARGILSCSSPRAPWL